MAGKSQLERYAALDFSVGAMDHPTYAFLHFNGKMAVLRFFRSFLIDFVARQSRVQSIRPPFQRASQR